MDPLWAPFWALFWTLWDPLGPLWAPLGPFWVHFGSILEAFGSLFSDFGVVRALCENVHPSAAKSYFLRFWGVNVPYFLRLVSGPDSSCNFRRVFVNFGALLAALRSLNEQFLGAFWLQFRVI